MANSNDRQSERYNPAENRQLYGDNPNNADTQQARAAREAQDLEAMYDAPSASGASVPAAEQLTSAEENPMGYSPASSRANESSRRGSNGSTSTGRRGTVRGAVKGIVKKKGPMSAIILALVGLGSVGTVLLTPAIGLVHIKEILLDDLNDQLTALDIRSDKVLRTKVDSMKKGVGFCSEAVNLRCKYSSMASKQADRLKKQGVTLTCDGGRECTKNALGRYSKIDAISYRGQSYADPGAFMRAVRSDTDLRASVRRAYNPKVVGFIDNVATRVYDRFGIGKDFILTSDDDRENKRTLATAAREGTQGSTDRLNNSNRDRDQLSEEQNQLADGLDSDIQSQVLDAKDSGTRVAAGALKGGFKGLSLLGAADTGCVAMQTGVAVSNGVKLVGMAQMAIYAHQFLTLADKIKYGDATERETNAAGNLLMAAVSSETIMAQKSNTPLGQNEFEAIPNPHYGKNAFDSPGYQVAAYKKPQRLTAQDKMYSLGGSFGVKELLQKIGLNRFGGDGTLKSLARTCGVVQNPFVQVAGILLSLGVGILSGGTSVIASAAFSAALGASIPFIEGMLIDVLAGNIITEDMTSVDSGNAIFAGSAGFMGQVAQTRGLSPLTTDEALESYLAKTAEVQNEYIAIEKHEARSDPLNIYSQYSFLGALTRQVATVTLPASPSPLTKLSQLASLPFQTISSVAGAQSSYTSARFDQCDDFIYQEYGMKADVFCNLRYGLSKEEQAMDVLGVVDYMISNNYADEEGNPVAGSDYERYLAACMNRTDPFGYTGEGGGNAADPYYTGEVCWDQGEMFRNFRVFYIDQSIESGMAEDEIVRSNQGGENGGSDEQGDGNATGDLGWPFKEADNSKLSMSRCYIPGTFSTGHLGLDIGAPEGTEIIAADGGEVVWTHSVGGAYPSYGNAVAIKHKDNLYTTYVHNLSNRVSVGDKVSKGQVIALVGNTGNSFGAHLHFEVSSIQPPYFPDTSNTSDPLRSVNIPNGVAGKTTAANCR